MKWVLISNTEHLVKNGIVLARMWKINSGYQIVVTLPDVEIDSHRFIDARCAKLAVAVAIEKWFERIGV